MEYVMKRSDELVEGDIVMASGMRCRLGEVKSAPDTDNGLAAEGLPELVFYSTGTILNVEEVNEQGLVPFSWRCETRPQFEGTDRYSRTGNKWQIQGNARARWHVEVQ